MEPIGKPEFLLCALYEMFLYVKNSCIALWQLQYRWTLTWSVLYVKPKSEWLLL
jgi:hypothetical protein